LLDEVGQRRDRQQSIQFEGGCPEDQRFNLGNLLDDVRPTVERRARCLLGIRAESGVAEGFHRLAGDVRDEVEVLVVVEDD
jgi:hypothetical protein